MRILVTGARGNVGAGEELMDAAGLPPHDVVRDNFGDEDRPDASGFSCAKTARLFGWKPSRHDLLDDGRLRPEAGEPAAAGESGVQRGRRAIS